MLISFLVISYTLQTLKHVSEEKFVSSAGGLGAHTCSQDAAHSVGVVQPARMRRGESTYGKKSRKSKNGE